VNFIDFRMHGATLGIKEYKIYFILKLYTKKASKELFYIYLEKNVNFC